MGSLGSFLIQNDIYIPKCSRDYLFESWSTPGGWVYRRHQLGHGSSSNRANLKAKQAEKLCTHHG